MNKTQVAQQAAGREYSVDQAAALIEDMMGEAEICITTSDEMIAVMAGNC